MNSLNSLKSLGFRPDTTPQHLLDLVEHDPSLCFARVAREDYGGRYLLISPAHDALRARQGGGLRARATSRLDLPGVGDWVVAHLIEPTAEEAHIWHVLPRHTQLVRQAASERTDPQLIAANVDLMIIVTSMNQEFELRRLERYLVTAKQAHCKPLLLLNKRDLAPDPDRFIEQATRIASDTPVLSSAAVSGQIEALLPWLGPGVTAVLVGSSGVGKSTLINALLGQQAQRVETIRADDDEGRHTTTARHLLRLPHDRGLLIDTPGMRELRLWSSGGDASEVFEDITRHAGGCRFRDCEHGDEPGCGVREAVARGDLEVWRLESWRKLQRELAHQARRQDAAAARAEFKKFGKMVKQIKRLKQQ